MRRLLERINTKDFIAGFGMVGSFSLIIIFRHDPEQAKTFKDVLTYIVIYYIGTKTEHLKKNGTGNGEGK